MPGAKMSICLISSTDRLCRGRDRAGHRVDAPPLLGGLARDENAVAEPHFNGTETLVLELLVERLADAVPGAELGDRVAIGRRRGVARFPAGIARHIGYSLTFR